MFFFLTSRREKAKREAGESPARSRHCIWEVVSGSEAIHWESGKEDTIETMSQETCMKLFFPDGGSEGGLEKQKYGLHHFAWCSFCMMYKRKS